MITDNQKSAIALEARHLLRAHRYGALCTLSKKFDGHPFGSITPYLVDHDGSLLILISTLAEHTKNILHDPRVSLITHNQENPHIQTQGRVTVLASAIPVADRDEAGIRYLRYFPEAQTYFSMHDFSFYRIVPETIRFIGGFGKIHWVKGVNYTVASYPLIAQEADILVELNALHEESIRLHTAQDGQKAELIGIDCDGFDIRVGDKMMRIQIDVPILDAQQARFAITRKPDR
jgi:putative heme iron utilization protein